MEIQAAGRTPNECKHKLEQLLNKVRHVRTLNECLEDVETMNKMPKMRVRSVYSRVLMKLAAEDLPKGTQLFSEASERLKNLSSEERAKLEAQVAHEREMLAIQRKANKLQHKLDTEPITPYSLFCKSELAKGNTS